MAIKSNNVITTLSIMAVLTIGAVGTINFANAHSSATGVVKERMMLMEDVGKSMKGIAGMIKGKAPYDSSEIARLSGIIQERGGDHLTKVFPAGSLDAPTEALPAIWSQWDRFSDLAAQLSIKAEALQKSSSAEKPVVMQAFGGLAKTCSTCHTDFREKKAN